jgi:uncharacterized protein
MGAVFAKNRGKAPSASRQATKGVNVFIDTSVWFAAANARDRLNARAKSLLNDISDPLLTDHVLVETWLLLNSRVGRHAAEQFWRRLRDSGIDVQKVTLGDLDVAWTIGQAFGDQTFSIVDRTSFAVMERLRVTRIASFDDDFAVYRYGRSRDKAFEVLR